MTTIPKKEKRTEILYAHVTKSNKKFLSNNYKKQGFSTLSDFVDTIISTLKNKAKNEND